MRGGARISRTKGAKNKKTIAKEKLQESKIDIKLTAKKERLQSKKPVVKQKLQEKKIITKPVKPIEPVINEEPKQRVALRLFTLEKRVHDNFINYISQFGDPKLYESYIVNELMVKYINNKIKLPKVDVERMHDFMMVYGHVGFEPGSSVEFDEMDEFKHANRLMARKNTNSFVQYQYLIAVDTDIKTSMMSKGFSTSYVVNELLKMYVEESIKVNLRDSRISEWEPKYKYAMRKSKKKE